jgi:hypothetical protein
LKCWRGLLLTDVILNAGLPFWAADRCVERSPAEEDRPCAMQG